MANKQLPDFLTAENELDGQELTYIAQNGKTRKSTLQKIKEFIIGTVAMGTTATNVTGAVKEINDKIGSEEKEGSIISSLNDNTQEINIIKENVKIEKGNFTPIIKGSTATGNNTYVVQNGRYYKIGKQVTATIDIALSSLDSALSGNILIGGLPFVPIADQSYRFSGTVSAFYGTTLDKIMACLIGNSSNINLYVPTANTTAFIPLKHTDINSNFRIIIELIYITD